MSDERLVNEHYAMGLERDRLETGVGAFELARTIEIVERRLPPPPGIVADVGGGPGRYSRWLASRGYDVIHRDLVPLHARQLLDDAAAESGRAGGRIHAAVADARALDVADGRADAVLLLGPLYHLTRREDRLSALREARRILRPGGVLFAAAITRWAPRLDGIVVKRLFTRFEEVRSVVEEVERTGVLPPMYPGSFAGYCHRPSELADEIRDAGLALEDLVSVEGIAFALGDLDERMADPQGRAVMLEAARAVERVPELLGLGPHMLATARRDA